ncbi:glycosyltransferase [Parapedobacter defluvii]|nr:glycosyltransferase [Parapedobacter defluvii]
MGQLETSFPETLNAIVIRISNMDYSIIICSFNPDDRLLLRCLEAVRLLDKRGIGVETIVVDNNSVPPLAERPYVRHFLNNSPDTRLVPAKEQGLVNARIAGIGAAQGQWALFLDDDNEVEPTYLQELRELRRRHPSVGAWGPGHVEVEFTDGIANGLEGLAYHIFQGKEIRFTEFASIRNWQPCYPFGTGLAMCMDILKPYVSWVKGGELSATGRKGATLASGEDIQMVMLCVREGFAAGQSPRLGVAHLIPAKRANLQYMGRLAFGSNLDFHAAIAELIPEYREEWAPQPQTAFKFGFKVIKRYGSWLWNATPAKKIKLATYIGSMTSLYGIHRKQLPKCVNFVIDRLKLR